MLIMMQEVVLDIKANFLICENLLLPSNRIKSILTIESEINDHKQ